MIRTNGQKVLVVLAVLALVAGAWWVIATLTQPQATNQEAAAMLECVPWAEGAFPDLDPVRVCTDWRFDQPGTYFDRFGQ